MAQVQARHDLRSCKSTSAMRSVSGFPFIASLPIRTKDSADSKSSSREPQHPKKPKGFAFKSLPPELRNAIYHTILGPYRPSRIHIQSADRHTKANKDQRCAVSYTAKGFRVPLSLMLSCKAIYNELTPMVYGSRFGFHEMEDLLAWLRSIGPRHRAHLRSVILTKHVGAADEVANCFQGYVQTRYRESSKQVATLLADSTQLIFLKMRFDYTKTQLRHFSVERKDSDLEVWVSEAKRIAEILYHDFLPLLVRGLSDGKTPQQLCRLLRVEKSTFAPQDWVNTPERTPVPVDERELKRAERVMWGHIRLLLCRKVQRDRLQ